MFKQFKLILLSAALMVLSAPSCTDIEDDAVTPANEKQLVRPSMFKCSVSANIASFTWNPVGYANYELQLCLSDNFESGVMTILVPNEMPEKVPEEMKNDENAGGRTRGWKVGNLPSNTRFYARIRSISINGSLEPSGYSPTINFTTQQENIIYAPPTGDVGIDYIKLSWDSVRVVTNITVTKGTDAPVDYVLTGGEIEHGRKEFSGLLANTEYTFRIYADDWLRGTRTIKTLEENIFKAIVSDNIGLDHVWLEWDNEKPSDQIVASASGKTDITVPITAGDFQKDITGLSPETTYTFKIYNGDVLRGTVAARTLTDYSVNILYDPAADDIDETFVNLEWNVDAFDVTHITVSTNTIGDKDHNVTLTENDINNHQKKIEGLTSLTEYTFRIYNGDILRGEVIVTTL